jgi:hypothetical protein
MNKKQQARVEALYRDGVSPEVCGSIIIGMSHNDTEASIFIHKFYEKMVIQPLLDDNDKLMEKIKDLSLGRTMTFKEEEDELSN